MSSFAMTRTAVLPEVSLRKARLLPRDGKVKVKVGDVLRPQDVVATAPKRAQPAVLMVGQALGVRSKDVARLVVRWAGETVRRDEVLAERKGLLGVGRRVFKSPCDGIVISGPHSAGEVVVGAAEEEVELLAGIGGRVVATVPLRGAIIETLVTYVQGAAGYGGEAAGTLVAATELGSDEIQGGRIDETCAGTVLVGGRIGREALDRAVQVGVVGIAVGAITGDGYKWLCQAQPPLAVMLAAPQSNGMPRATFELLKSRAGMPALLNGEPRAEAPSELIVTLAGAHRASGPPRVEMGLGATVRIIAGPAAGTEGRVTAFPTIGRRLPSGISASVADVELEDGEKVAVPRCNLMQESR